MFIYLCPKCFQVFACQNGKTLTYCSECSNYITKALPCPTYEKANKVILDAWCVSCSQKYLAELN